MNSIETIVACALKVDAQHISDDTGYQSIAEWDSFAHVNLMLRLADEFEVEMTNELMLELSSIRAIKEFSRGLRGTADVAAAVEVAGLLPATPREQASVHRGLNGVTFDRSAITHIDSEHGRLSYRGYDINDVAEHASFEETVWLLLEGELPTAAESSRFATDLGNDRNVPEPVIAILAAMNHAHPMDALRTAVSALATLDPEVATAGADAAKRSGLRLLAQVPTLIATHHALRCGRAPLAPAPHLSHARDFARMLLARDLSPELARLIDQDLIVHADHSSNASTFAARVATGCGVSIHSAITAALSTFAGPLHGGAVEQALRQVDQIGAPEHAAAYVRDRQSQNKPIMGFGHRVYRTEDPRVRHFRATAATLSRLHKDTRAFEIVEALVDAMQPFARLGIGANVDLYAGLVYRLLGLPDDLAVAIFAAGRMPGWLAHVLEQRAENILIRPLLHYVGQPSRPFLPVAERTSKANAWLAA
jgi:citrate synthase